MDGQPAVGNARYYGYCIEMLEEISKLVGFKYEIVEVADNNYGSQKEDKTWNGMVGELIERVRTNIRRGSTLWPITLCGKPKNCGDPFD